MSNASPRTNYKVAVLVYEGASILDFTGPMQVLSHVSPNHQKGDLSPIPIFKIKTVSQNPLIHLSRSINIEPDILLPSVRDNIKDFDILIVPGAPMSVIRRMIQNNASPELDLIRRYTTTESDRPRLLLSVCTGAFLLGASGLLSGLTVTTHYRALDELRDLCSALEDLKQGKVSTNVVHRRFVDAGSLKGTKVQIITSGGISAGIDAAFYIVCKLLGAEAASSASRDMEYGWMEVQDVDWPRKFHCSLD
ncbi:ThiJ/PfpI family protein [Penicillium malachiteum]|uniref:ThiJ/PfpI family protein n=1 Tax=Penicillium malachiteum TaxID=1324776 RepID=UPI00254824D7|nr:ThiJ/PfpI family protein [Penicillium malachiteum]KAJ5730880.1 ThiJ/PfpI family protein [Penicillium malachiteum]